jgi:hypothetical protein
MALIYWKGVFVSVLDEWSDSNKLPKVEIELKTSGPATVETVGDASRTSSRIYELSSGNAVGIITINCLLLIRDR